MLTQPVESTFRVAVRRMDPVAILDLHGEINAAAEEALNAAYDEAAQDGVRTVVLSFGGVDYINSTGIALIVGLLARARKDRRKVSAFGLSDHYVEIFQITRLSDFMHIHTDEANAVRNLD